MPKKKLIMPKLDCQQYAVIQETFCAAAKKNCDAVHCSECLYYIINLDHFVWFFELQDCHGSVEVIK